MSKPNGWNKLPKEKQIELAREFLCSTRGHYILGQALALAMLSMDKVKGSMRENNNIQDVEILSVLFEPYYSMTLDAHKWGAQ